MRENFNFFDWLQDLNARVEKLDGSRHVVMYNYLDFLEDKIIYPQNEGIESNGVLYHRNYLDSRTQIPVYATVSSICTTELTTLKELTNESSAITWSERSVARIKKIGFIS